MTELPAAPKKAGANATSGRQSFEQLARQAEQYRQASQFPEAIKLYREGLRQRPSWGAGWLGLGTIYYMQNRFVEARDALARSAELAPGSAFVYALLGLSEYETGDYEPALEHLRKSSAGKGAADRQFVSVVNFRLALLLTRLGRFEEALQLLGGMASQQVNGPDLTEGLGLAALRIPNLPQEYPPERREAVWLAGEAVRHRIAGEPELAEDFSSRLKAHYPAVGLDLANVYKSLGRVPGKPEALPGSKATRRGGPSSAVPAVRKQGLSQ